MAYDFSYEITDELMRAGARRARRHQLGRRPWVALAVLALILYPLWISDPGGYLLGFFAGALALLVAVLAFTSTLPGRRAVRKARTLPTRAASCSIAEDGMTLENALAKSTVKWPLVEKVVRAPDVWLFFLSRQQYFALPADRLAGETGAFVERRLAAAGGKLY